ncbi:MAG TPA: ABC transporter ATP-binding protein [Solirubrobacterales bacterium]
MPVEKTIPTPSAMADSPAPSEEVAIEVSDLHKAFRIPTHRIDSFKERVVRPFSSREYRELRALDGVSFEVRKGEFFGIVGRNGSGKSTLLKLLASIYKADAGKIRMAGRLAPFIELGVGFNLELTARENVILNGVMMGLTPRETRQRLDAVLDFAELRDFVDLKLKNYSSGMMVRLAFSTMMEADADILLIDEVLAVGDAAFQQKCADAFREMKGQRKTIVLVTHEMGTVEEYCHRAMLIDGGRISQIGDPSEIGRHYLRLNFESGVDAGRETVTEITDGVNLVDIWLESEKGERIASVEHGERIRLRAELEVVREMPGVSVGFTIGNADGINIVQLGAGVPGSGKTHIVRAGQRIQVTAEMENPLAPGRYFVHCAVERNPGSTTAMLVHSALDFVVFGTPSQGVVSLEHEISADVEEER